MHERAIHGDVSLPTDQPAAEVAQPGDGPFDLPSPWMHNMLGIPANAQWIWHDSGTYPGGGYPAPFGGWNHNEFLIFRVPGIVPEPAALMLLGLGTLMIRRRG